MRYIHYPASNVKELNFTNGSFEIDISFLEENEHQIAFLDIFESTLIENRISINSLKSINSAEVDKQIKEVRSFSSLKELASYLYSLHTSEVKIDILMSGINRTLTVRFDNPSFSFKTK